MFSSKVNLLQLTALMLEASIDKVVVCPGSRNAAIVHTFKEAGLDCYEVTDERSAGFFALGLVEANGGKPVAVCCTSGSAVVNLAPAVVEAYYRPLPLFVVTADRPAMWIGQMDGQTMVQPNVFEKYVAHSVTLPEPRDDEEQWYCNRLINEALLAMNKTGRPVHVNVPLTEPLFDFTAESLPCQRLVKHVRPSNIEPQSIDLDIKSQYRRKMIVVGQLTPEVARRCCPMLDALAHSGWVVLAEALSNLHIAPSLREAVVGNFDDILAADTPRIAPELLVTMGGHIVSKRLKAYLRTNKASVHYHVSPNGELADTYQSMTHLVETDEATMLKALCDVDGGEKDEEFISQWQCKTEQESMPLLETLFAKLSDKWVLHIGNSSVLRKVQRVFRGANEVYCNRGINGIEGSVSLAVGYWAGSKRPTMLVVGDLSFFYDQNGLWNKYVAKGEGNTPLRILIINNGGGQIFYGLKGLKASPYLDESIAASHKTSAEGIAKECGCSYLSASNEKEYERAIGELVDMTNRGVMILEVFTQGF